MYQNYLNTLQKKQSEINRMECRKEKCKVLLFGQNNQVIVYTHLKFCYPNIVCSFFLLWLGTKSLRNYLASGSQSHSICLAQLEGFACICICASLQGAESCAMPPPLLPDPVPPAVTWVKVQASRKLCQS